MIMYERPLLKSTNDYVFKKIFGQKGNEDITRGLIEAITGVRYEEINLETNPILESELYDEKTGILDVRLTANKSNDIEMQIVKPKHISDRVLWYWAKMYSQALKRGDGYDNTKKAICILIADFKIDDFEHIKDCHTEWKIKEKDFPEVTLTDKLEIHIIELGKLKNTSENNSLIEWCNFFNNPEKMEGLDMSENEAIKRAREVLYELSQDPHEVRMAELREKAIKDSMAIREAGFDDGKAEGIKETQITMVKNMLKENIEIELISRVTGLKVEEIIKIKEEK